MNGASALVLHDQPMLEVPDIDLGIPRAGRSMIGGGLGVYTRPLEAFICEAEGNGRFFRVEVRPGMSEGQYLGLMLKRWGRGRECVAEGQPHFYSRREDAILSGRRWVEAGR